MNDSKLLPLLAAAVIAGGAYYYLRGGAPSDPVARTQTSSEVAVSGPAVAPASSIASPVSSSPAPVGILAPGIADQLQSGLDQPSQVVDQMEAAWVADLQDPDTAMAVEQSLVQTLEAERMLQVRDQPTRVSGLNCRATMCRIEAVFPAGQTGSEWGTRLLLELGGTFIGSQMVALPSAEGETRLVVYAQRSGAIAR